LRGHANPGRPGYALGDEAGLLLCSWPRGGRPTLPFPYADEVWTGIEYQVASHLIAEGLVAEGLAMVKAVRARYDGLKRNPWNEYECGNYYARAMASWALLIACSGFWYSAPTRTLCLAPRVDRNPFRCFLSTATGWGRLVLHPDRLELHLEEGELVVDELRVEIGGETLLSSPRRCFHAGRKGTIRLER
jgi:non-lysosomal glucosylceramidase